MHIPEGTYYPQNFEGELTLEGNGTGYGKYCYETYNKEPCYITYGNATGQVETAYANTGFHYKFEPDSFTLQDADVNGSPCGKVLKID